MTLSKEKKGEIAYQILRSIVRRKTSFQDIADAKRRIGNLLKEPEMIEEGIRKDELLEFGELILRQVFGDLVDGMCIL
jgi:hypothetical protein